LASFKQQGAIYTAAFSPDGSRILTAGDDKAAKLWDTQSGKLLAAFEHQGAVSTAVFSPDGSHILTAIDDDTAKLCDIATPRDIARDIQQFSIRESDAESRFATASSPITQSEAISEIARGLQVSHEGSLVPLEDEHRS
jgi:WD40 repeat protein